MNPIDKPGPMFCEGWHITLNDSVKGQKAGLFKEGALARLKGRFLVKGFAGPNQGMMSIILLSIVILGEGLICPLLSKQ